MRENTNIFEYAVRNKLRFPYKGLISVEDLWDLSVVELDKIFKTLNAEIKKEHEESLLNPQIHDEVPVIMIEIVRHVVNYKLEEQASREKEADKARERQKIMAILAKKQDESLENKSADELIELLESLR